MIKHFELFWAVYIHCISKNNDWKVIFFPCNLIKKFHNILDSLHKVKYFNDFFACETDI